MGDRKFYFSSRGPRDRQGGVGGLQGPRTTSAEDSGQEVPPPREPTVSALNDWYKESSVVLRTPLDSRADGARWILYSRCPQASRSV